MRLHYIVFLILACLAIRVSNTARAQTNIFLTTPDCYPNCNSEDQLSLLKEGKTEKTVTDAIAQAKKEIRFSIYTFSRKPIFNALITANIERGVRLRGLVDRSQLDSLKPYCEADRCDLASLLPNQDWANLSLTQRIELLEPLDLYKNASLAGKLLLLSFQNEDQIAIRVGSGQNRLMHNKFLIIDDQILQTSSGNWSSTAMSVNFENTIEFHAATQSNTIAAHICAFEAIWDRPARNVSQALALCKITDQVYFTPTNTESQSIEERIFSAIKYSKFSIDISMHHLAHPDIYSALSEATIRGVTVRILLDDDDCPNETPILLRNLINNGSERVYVRYLPTQCKINQLSHNRFGIFDGSLLINGSANWSKAGLKSNYESFQVFSDPNSVDRFRNHFETLYKQAKEKASCRCQLRLSACREQYCRGEFSPQFPRFTSR